MVVKADIPELRTAGACDVTLGAKVLVFNRSGHSGHSGHTGHTSITLCLASWLKQTMTILNAFG